MTMEGYNVIAKFAFAMAVYPNNLSTDEEISTWFEGNPVYCPCVKEKIHRAYHKARSQMRRRGRLTRPQKREWHQVRIAFQWLWDHNVIVINNWHYNECRDCDDGLRLICGY